jgi:hypothetical protein
MFQVSYINSVTKCVIMYVSDFLVFEIVDSWAADQRYLDISMIWASRLGYQFKSNAIA